MKTRKKHVQISVSIELVYQENIIVNEQNRFEIPLFKEKKTVIELLE